jgi:hypothetical protein
MLEVFAFFFASHKNPYGERLKFASFHEMFHRLTSRECGDVGWVGVESFIVSPHVEGFASALMKRKAMKMKLENLLQPLFSSLPTRSVSLLLIFR